MTQSNVGIETEYRSFDDYFKSMLMAYEFARDSKTLQKAYVEVFTEKDLPDPIEDLFYEYEVGFCSSGGFGGDVALYYVLERLKKIKETFNLSIKFYCIGDYDAEGEHIIKKIKERYEPFGIDIKKLAITKQQVVDLQLVPNKGYREKMMKPKTLKYHMQKQYVWDFFEANKDICPPDGICQFELEGLETTYLLELLKSTATRHISLETIKHSRAIFRREAQEWAKNHVS
ncbi:hypothetical protein ES702_07526 [subsurface metagenome]